MGQSWSFRKKLVVTWLALQGVVTLLVAFMIIWVGESYITRTLDQYGQQLKPLIKSALVVPMIQRDYASVQAISNEIFSEKTLFDLSIADANGRTLYAKTKRTSGDAIDPKAAATRPFSTRLDFEGVRLGEVVFTLDLTEFRRDQNLLLWLVSGLTAISILLFLTVSGFLSKQLTAPLIELVNAVRRYQINSDKNLFKTNQTGEIGKLSEAFLQLTVEIEEKINTLNNFNDTLEERIKQRTAEIEVLLQQIQERQKSESLGNLAANIAHELNTPLGIAVTSISHLKETCHALEIELKSPNPSAQRINEFFEDQKDALELVVNNLEKCDKLVRDFKAMSKGTDESISENVDLVPYTNLILRAHDSTLKRLPCEVILTGDESLNVALNLNAYSQILDALIDNAISHAFEPNKKAQIKIHVAKIDGDIRVTFNDNGRGISPTILTTLFDPFVSTQRAQGKTGLGLYMARKSAVETLNGGLEVMNLPDGGAGFTLTFPV